MRIVEMSINDFNEFAKSHPLKNYCQSSSYALFMSDLGFSYEYIGYEDNGTIIAASLILYKRITGLQKYAYAPKGFLIDYYNKDLVEMFTKDLVEYLKPKNIVFIKINPEIIIAELKGKKSLSSTYNKNVKIIDDLKDINYKRRRELKELEFIHPRISGYINLKSYNINDLDKDMAKATSYSLQKGLEYEVASSREVKYFYDFIKNKTNKNINYYRNLLNIFKKEDMAELILIKVNYKKFLLDAKEAYEVELENNNQYNELIQNFNTERNLNRKMESDKLLLELKNNIVEATEGIKRNPSEYIAGAIVIKYENRATIFEYGMNDAFENLYPNHFLFNKLAEIYKNNYDYLDIGGFSSDISTFSESYEESQFKLQYNPVLYEFIGELDYIINEFNFKNLQIRDAISKEMESIK